MKKSRKGSSSTTPFSSQHRQQQPQQKLEKVEEHPDIAEVHREADDDYNSGFGAYLRSTQGIEMMKMFVMANTLLVVLTMAWPNMKHIYGWIKEAITGVEYFDY